MFCAIILQQRAAPCQIPQVEVYRITVEFALFHRDSALLRANFVFVLHDQEIFPTLRRGNNFRLTFAPPFAIIFYEIHTKREYGETGRRKGLKIPRERSRIGSNPITRTRKGALWGAFFGAR